MAARHTDLHSNLGFDPDALRERYRRERDKRLRDRRRRSVHRDGRRVRPLCGRRSVRRARLHARRRSTNEIDVVIIGGGFSGTACRGSADASGASPTSASSRRAATSAAPGTGTGTRVRSATSSRTATCRCSKRLGVHAEGEVLVRAEIFEHLAAHRPALRPLRQHVLPDARAPDCDWDEDRSALARVDQSRRRHPRALRDSGARHRRAGRSCPASRASRLRGPLVPHQPLGLRLHRRRSRPAV